MAASAPTHAHRTQLLLEADDRQKVNKQNLLGDPEVTADLYCNFAYIVLGRMRDLHYIFAVTSGSPGIYY